MQWSDPSNHQGVIQRTYFLTFGDSLDHTADWPLTDLTASGNLALAIVAKKLWKAADIWATKAGIKSFKVCKESDL